MPSPDAEAELLVRHVTGRSRAQRLRAEGQQLDAADAEQLERLVARREKREPVQLLTGSVGFRYLEVEVRAGVFIPRPETEVLAGEAIARVPAGGVVVEPCTGTGAIACAVATETEASLVVATDISADAVALARSNAIRSGAAVEVLQGNLLDPVAPSLHASVDVLVSNPPYLTPQDLAAAEPEVAAWDPEVALVSGSTGHEITDRLIAAGSVWLRPGGWLLLEVNSSRAAQTADRATGAGLVEVEVLADLTGADRIVIARRP